MTFPFDTPPDSPFPAEPYEPVAAEPYEPVAPESYEPVAAEPYEPVAPESYEPVAAEPYEPAAAEPDEPDAPESYEPAAPESYEPLAAEPYEPVAAERYEPAAPERYEPAAPERYEPAAPERYEPAAPERYESVAPVSYPSAAPSPVSASDRPYVSIILPCHNEEGHVVTEVERICRAMDASGYTYELVAYDDASTDGTLTRLREVAPVFPNMRIVHFRRNGGSGTVRRIGTQNARGEIVVWTDADMTYPNERIPEFVQMIEKDEMLDQVVGARTTEEGTHKFFRVPAKWFIRKIAEILTNTKIPDLNSGLRAFRRQVSLPYLRLLPPGFSCVTTITIAFLSNQHDVRYVPIEYGKRAGTSKFKFVRDAYRYILQVLRMVMYFNPLKVLMPLALTLLGLGIAKGIFDQFRHPLHFAENTVLIFVSGLIIATLALLADLIVRSRGDI